MRDVLDEASFELRLSHLSQIGHHAVAIDIVKFVL